MLFVGSRPQSASAFLFAGTFFLASDLRSRTCTDVQGRFFDAFLAMHDLQIKKTVRL
jgi:hypothetical protein